MTDNSTMSDRTTTARRVPTLLLAALVAKALWLSWLGYYGFPHSTSDSVCFKQPAYMRLFTPYYSIPSYVGRCPIPEKINSYPSAVYTYVNYAAFRAFGFSQHTSSAVDLAIHFGVSAVGALALWKLTGRQFPALLFLLGSSQWFIISGRPEELGILLVMTSLLTFQRGVWGMAWAILGLGLAGVTSPGSAVVGTTLLVSYDGIRKNFRHGFWRRAALLLTLPVLIAGAVYVGYVYPYVSEAWQQDRILRADGFYSTATLPHMVRTNPLWALATLPPIFAAIGVAIYAYWRRPAWFPRDSAVGAFLLAAGMTVFVGMMLNAIALRLEYDYRHILALSWAALAIWISLLRTENGSYQPRAWAFAAMMLVVSLPMQRDIVRQTLAPLAWMDNAVDYRRAQEIVATVVPPGATVGGDGNAWATINDGRPFLITRTVSDNQWPEYVVCMNWAKTPEKAFGSEIADRMDAEYKEITPQPLLPIDGCGLNVLGFEIPIARGRCDWYVRIWKRRGS